MNRTKILWVLGGCFILFISFFFYKLRTFSMFDEELKLIKEIKIPNKNYTFKIYSIPSNATTQSNLQIRKSQNNSEEVIDNFETYNHLNNYKIINDSIYLFISDSSEIKQSFKEVKIKLSQ